MATVFLILGFVIACGLGITWDYYKPARFRTSYRNVDERRSDGGGYISDNDCGGDGGGGGD
ncbi:hypothetical protein [Sulfitobacter sp.]|uniref:hypothetical protein n=1 Tax=Sulfitobacter sp. TaxID=1903071 RepID=UPI003002F58D